MGFQADIGEEEDASSSSDADGASDPRPDGGRPRSENDPEGGTLAGAVAKDGDEETTATGPGVGGDPNENDTGNDDSIPLDLGLDAESDGKDEEENAPADSTHFGMPAVEDEESAPDEAGEIDSFLESIEMEEDEQPDEDESDSPNPDPEASASGQESDEANQSHNRARERQASRPSQKNSGARYSTQLGMPKADQQEVLSGESSTASSDASENTEDATARDTYDLEEDSPTAEFERDEYENLSEASERSTPGEPLGGPPSSGNTATSSGDGDLWNGPDVEPDRSSEDGLEFPSSPGGDDDSQNDRGARVRSGDFEGEDTPESGIIRFSERDEISSHGAEGDSSRSETFQGGASGILNVPENEEAPSEQEEPTSSDASSPDRDPRDTSSGILGSSTYMRGQEDSGARERIDSSSSTVHGTPAEPTSTPEEGSESRSAREGLTDDGGGPTDFDIDDDSQEIELGESLENEALSSLSESSARIEPNLPEGEAGDETESSEKLSGFQSADEPARTGHTPNPADKGSLEHASDLVGRDDASENEASASAMRSDEELASTSNDEETPAATPHTEAAPRNEDEDAPDASARTPEASPTASSASSPAPSEANPDRATADEGPPDPRENAETRLEHDDAAPDASPSESGDDTADAPTLERGDLGSSGVDRPESEDEPEALELESPQAPPVDDSPDAPASPGPSPTPDASSSAPQTEATSPNRKQARDDTSSPEVASESRPEKDAEGGELGRIAAVSALFAAVVTGVVAFVSFSIPTATIGFGVWALATAGLAFAWSDDDASSETDAPSSDD
jgi:hypothetical protein